MAYGLGGSTSLTNVGLAFLTVATLLVADQVMHRILRAPCVIAALLTAFLLVVGAVATAREPHLATQHWNFTSELLRIAGLPAIAAGWWLVNGRLSYRVLWWLLSIGLIVGEIPCLDWTKVYDSPLPSRAIIDLTQRNPNGVGFLAGVHLLAGLLPLIAIASSSRGQAPGGWRTPTVLLGSSLIAAYPLLAAQSRGAFVGVAAGVVALVLVTLVASLRDRQPHDRRRMAAIVGLLALVLALVAQTPVGGVVAERFHGVTNVAFQYWANRAEPIPEEGGSNRPLRLRLEMWKYGLSLAPERPVFGHGPASAEALLARADEPSIRGQDGFHDVWIQWLVTIGAIATLGFLMLYGGLARISVRAALKGHEPIDLVAVGLWAYMGTFTLVDLRYNHPSGITFLWLVGGLSFAHVLRPATSDPEERS